LIDPKDPSKSAKPRVRRSRKEQETVRGRVRAHDPFELIRWLALSQPDPRKALAELVQNSLDAGARRIVITRVRERGAVCLKILDNGEGVIPEMERAEALRYIATHIGHSRKRSLSPQDRMTLMTQGQYGIGLLGFWSLGEVLEMRSAVPGQRSHRLVLHRDRPDFLLEPLRGRLALDERWTEVVVVGVHREAMAVLGGRRAADYLASELRGQLLSRTVDLQLEDRISRGRAQKRFQVKPPRFLGERLPDLGPIDVPGHSPIRFEIYFCGGNGDGSAEAGVSVYCAGTQVAEGFHELAALGLDRSPWNDPRLSGMVDFPDFRVAPGSRRGVVLDETSAAFARALVQVEPVLNRALEMIERRRSEELDRGMIRDLQRAFRDFYRRSPRFAMLPVATEADQGAGPDGTGSAAGAGPGAGAQREPDAGGLEADADAAAANGEAANEGAEVGAAPQPIELFPPGPLDSVRILPARLRVECGAIREVRAEGCDATGRLIGEPMRIEWSLEGPVGSITPLVEDGRRATFHAGGDPAVGILRARVRAGNVEAWGEAPVVVVEQGRLRTSGEGIPEPELLDQPGLNWRSRMSEERWQVNAGHRDYRAIADRPPLKLRYLAMLFAKEVVLRSHQDPRLEIPLEQMAEVIAYADRNLSRRGKKGEGRNEE
jgi:hypothetical protein